MAHGRRHATVAFDARVLLVHRKDGMNRFLSQLGDTSVPIGQVQTIEMRLAGFGRHGWFTVRDSASVTSRTRFYPAR